MSKKLIKTSAIIFILTLFVKVAGFLREIAVGYYAGTSIIADAYNISNVIPHFFLVAITQIVTISFIPLFLSIETDEGNFESNKFVNNCLFIALIITSIFSVCIFLFPNLLTTFFASGVSEETKEVSSQLLKICCWSVIFQSFTIIFSSFLNAKKRFVPPILCGLFLDGATILFFFLFSKTQETYLIGFIQLISSLLQAIFLIAWAFGSGFRFRISKKLFNQNIKKMLYISIPAIISVGVYEINVLVDKNFGSHFSTGAISSLSYAQTVNNLFYTLIVNSIILVAYTSFSDSIAKKQNDEATKLLVSSVKTILIITVPLSIIVSLNAKDIITFLFMRGKFDAESVRLTYKNLICYSVGLPFLCLSFLAVRFLYANKNHYPAIVISSIGLVINICCNFLSYYLTELGTSGIAAATTISSLIQTFLLYLYIFKKYSVSFGKKDCFQVFLPFISLIILVPVNLGVALLFKNIQNLFIKLSLRMLAILITYLIVLLVFNPNIFVKIKDSITGKILKKKD